MPKARAVLVLAAFLCAAESAQGVRITEFPLPSAGISTLPNGIAAGPDGALWFTNLAGARIGRITTSGAVTEFPLAPGASAGAIVAGPDGALWFNEYDRIGRITTTGTVTEFHPLPPERRLITDLTVGPDGSLWYGTQEFNPSGTGVIGRIGRLTTAGVSKVFDLPSPDVTPYAITSGADGNLWFAGATSVGRGFIGRITTAGDAQLRFLVAGVPRGIASGPNGAIWFTASVALSLGPRSGEPLVVAKIGRLSTDLSGELDEFVIPTSEAIPWTIRAGPDGNMWFTEQLFSGSSRVGRITPGGAITELAPPSFFGGQNAIAAGPDGALWLAEGASEKIGRISGIQAICSPSSANLCLGEGRFSVEASWTKSDGATGAATAVPIASLIGPASPAGYFWFFSQNAPEVFVRSIDGCAFNGKQWFFAGSLTDVGVTLNVTDVESGTTKTYSRPPGTPFAPIQDTEAAPCLFEPASLRPPSGR